MKHKLPMFAIMAVTSQLALADAANDPHFETAAKDDNRLGNSVPANLDPDWSEAGSHPELSDLSIGIEQELQDKLDGKMDDSLQFDLPPRNPSDPEFAGTH